MYTEEIKYFGLYTQLSLEDGFVKVTEMKEKIKKCDSAESLKEIIRVHYRFGNCWRINDDNGKATKLECMDPSGKVRFLLVKKEVSDEIIDKSNSYIVVKCVEREISILAVCDSTELAYKEMAEDVAKVLELPEVPSDWGNVEFARYNEFDVQADSAWVNGKDDYDWKILSV